MPHPQKIRSLARLVSRSPLRSRRSRSLSRSSERNRSRIRDSANASNTGNILFVGGLSKRATSEDLIRHFTSPGMPGKGIGTGAPKVTFEVNSIKKRLPQKNGVELPVPTLLLITQWNSEIYNREVLECEVVRHPQYKESRGFAFVTMETISDADCCVRYLNQTDLFGRLMTVEKAERSRRWSPTPGIYESLKNNRGHDSRQSRSYSPCGWHKDDSYSRRGRSRTRSPYGRGDYSPRGWHKDDSYSRRGRTRSPYGRRDYSPRAWDEKADSYSRRRRSRSRSPYGRRDYSPRRRRSRSGSPYGRRDKFLAS